VYSKLQVDENPVVVLIWLL